MAKLPELIDVRRAAKELGVSVRRVQQLIQGERLPAIELGTGYVIRSADLASVRVRRPGRPRKNQATARKRS